jgi:hypothetical protein
MADIELVIKIPEEIAGGRSANVSSLLNKENMQRATGKGL